MSERGSNLVVIPIDRITTCPFQPRVNVSIKHVRKLADSILSGRHDPVVDVEVLPDQAGRYQIVCGEQRWRAARDAGLTQVLARVHPPLDHLHRLQKQYEENRLRQDLDPIEEAHCILMHKTLTDIAVAESLLRSGGITFRSLEEKRVRARAEFANHLDGLRRLLSEHTPLSPWRNTERALGISETTRKTKVGILRLPNELREALRKAPAEHAAQISRLTENAHQQELTARAAQLTHKQIRQAVERLRREPGLSVDEALGTPVTPAADPVAFDTQLLRLVDMCRQLARLVRNLAPRVADEQRELIRSILEALHDETATSEEAA